MPSLDVILNRFRLNCGDSESKAPLKNIPRQLWLDKPTSVTVDQRRRRLVAPDLACFLKKWSIGHRGLTEECVRNSREYTQLQEVIQSHGKSFAREPLNETSRSHSRRSSEPSFRSSSSTSRIKSSLSFDEKMNIAKKSSVGKVLEIRYQGPSLSQGFLFSEAFINSAAQSYGNTEGEHRIPKNRKEEKERPLFKQPQRSSLTAMLTEQWSSSENAEKTSGSDLLIGRERQQGEEACNVSSEFEDRLIEGQPLPLSFDEERVSDGFEEPASASSQYKGNNSETNKMSDDFFFQQFGRDSTLGESLILRIYLPPYEISDAELVRASRLLSSYANDTSRGPSHIAGHQVISNNFDTKSPLKAYHSACNLTTSDPTPSKVQGVLAKCLYTLEASPSTKISEVLGSLRGLLNQRVSCSSSLIKPDDNFLSLFLSCAWEIYPAIKDFSVHRTVDGKKQRMHRRPPDMTYSPINNQQTIGDLESTELAVWLLDSPIALMDDTESNKPEDTYGRDMAHYMAKLHRQLEKIVARVRTPPISATPSLFDIVHYSPKRSTPDSIKEEDSSIQPCYNCNFSVDEGDGKSDSSSIVSDELHI